MTRARDVADTQDNNGGAVAPFVAGRNRILNSDFSIWQRGTSFSNPSSGAYLADRWNLTWNGSGATRTISRQTFTPGSAPTSGYEGSFFLRYDQSVAGTGGGGNYFQQFVEDVRTLAGQTITISFWAKADTTRNLPVNFQQVFGSGGSSTVDTSVGTATLTTSWQRFSFTISNPSIFGKTIGSNSYCNLYFTIAANTVQTIDIWGVQVEAGSVATPFTTASGGSQQAELAMCQRYYQRHGSASANIDLTGLGVCISSTEAYVPFTLFTPLRVAPTSIDYAQVRISDITTIAVDDATVVVTSAGSDFVVLLATKAAAGFTTNRPCVLRVDPSGNGYIGISAEL